MFDKKRSLVWAIVLYVLGLGLLIPNIIFSYSAWHAGATALTAVSGLLLLGAVFLTVVSVRLYKKDRMVVAPSKTIENEIMEKYKRIESLTLKYNQGNLTGIDIKTSEQGDFIFVGNIDLGEMGTVKGDKVFIDLDMDELRQNNENELSAEEARQTAIKLVSEFQNKLATYSHNLKNYFLLNMLIYTCDATDSEFWLYYRKCKDKYSDEQCQEIFDNVTENEIDLYDLVDKHSEKGLMSEFEVDIEKFIKDKFEFFDYEAFWQGIEFECVYFKKDTVSIQFSDNTCNLFCGAYEEFDEQLHPLDYHNF